MTEETRSPDPEVPAKVDPEPLVVRSNPLRAIRFKRGAIVGMVACLTLIIVGAAWFALKPRVFQIVAEDEQHDPPAKPFTEAFDHAPTDYSQVPRLGPPLPGDLGKPILERQRSLEWDNGLGRADLQGTEQARAVQTERERRAAELKAARESGLLVQTGGRPDPVGFEQPVPSGMALSSPEPGTRATLDPDRDPNAQGHKAEFVATRDREGNVSPHVLTKPASPYMLSAGSVIAASLITGLRSDLPGLVTAQVTQNVYDSATGRFLLIPQGARLIGTYDSVVAFGQRRALVVWQRIVFPDATSIRIDNVPSTDAAGYAGLQDKVDFHTWALLKGVMLSTLLGVSSELALSGRSDLVQAIRMSTEGNVSRAGDQITQRNLQVQPTITIRPGADVRLIVHRDLVLMPWKG